MIEEVWVLMKLQLELNTHVYSDTESHVLLPKSLNWITESRRDPSRIIYRKGFRRREN